MNLVDWQWAHNASPANACNSPIGFLNVADFYKGVNDIGGNEMMFAHILEGKGRGDLAQFVRDGRLQHQFAFCCGYDLVDLEGFIGLFRGLRGGTGVDAGLEWNEWKSIALLRYKDESRLQELIKKEE